jgi:hypothetical protein
MLPDLLPYLWQLHFADGSVLLQDAGDGMLREWATVTTLLQGGGRIARIALIPTIAGLPAHLVSVPPGATPIYFRLTKDGKPRRRAKTPRPPAIICAGWEYAEETPEIGCYLFAFFDGSAVMSSRRDEVQP